MLSQSMKCAAFLLAVSLISNTAVSQWTQTSGPVGAHSREIFAIQNHLIVNGWDGGVFRSADKGQTWESIHTGLPTDFRCFTLDTANRQLYIGTDRGIYSSHDLGDSWQIITYDVIPTSLEVSGDEIFAGSYSNGGMFYSSDGGSTWSARYPPGGNETVRRILKVGNRIWIGTDSKVYVSSDNGLTWYSPALPLIPSGLYTEGDDLYILGNNEYGYFTINKSTDQGASWTQLFQTQETNVASAGFVKLSNDLFISGAFTFYHSADNGLTWSDQTLPPGFTFFAQSFMTAIDNDLFVSYSDGILSSGDKGGTWQRQNIGYSNHTITQLQKTTSAVVSFNEQNGVFVSTDDGSYWEAVHERSLFIPRSIYAYDNTIITCYDLVLYKSVDNGLTWQVLFTLTDDIPGTHFVPVPHLAGSKESLVFCTYKGIYLSKNFGATWNFKPTSSLEADAPLIKSFVHGDTVIAISDKEMFYSIDFGNSWKKKGIPSGITAIYYGITDMIIENSSITMSTLFGLFRSADFGSTWKNISCVPDHLIFDMEKIDGTLVLCTFSGVYLNDNLGWYAVRDGLPNDARALSMVVKDRFTFLGTWGKSVWKIPTTELLMTGEFISTEGEEIPKPMLKNDCSTITVTNPKSGIQIKWYKDGNLIPNETAQTLTTTGDGNYAVSFENVCDLKMSDEVNLGKQEFPDIEIYNVITVDGDGKNDFYFVEDTLLGSRLQVYNRWGDILYANESYYNDWSPDQLSVGQYFYSIESKCFGKFKGTLTVMKP
jgi:photosystem II stability/assembly factor-like uncharacterized protein